MSAFFEEPPQEPAKEPAAVPRWARLSSRWLLSPVIADAVLARTPTVVLYVHLVRTCPDAFAFRLLAAPAQGHRLHFFAFSMMSRMLRDRSSDADTPRLSQFANTPFADMFGESRDPFLLEVELADGTRASPTEAFEAINEGREPRGTILAESGGGTTGGGSAHTADWVVSPLPEGDVRLVVEWGDEGVPRVEHVIPRQKLADGAAKAVKLPPWEE